MTARRGGSLLMAGAMAAGLVHGAQAHCSSAADQAACRPFLERLIALARPRALLVMGDSAARGFLGLTDPILKARGGWTEWRGAHEAGASAPALATLSPAFVLARPAMRKAAWCDILTLAAQVDSPEPDR